MNSWVIWAFAAGLGVALLAIAWYFVEANRESFIRERVEAYVRLTSLAGKESKVDIRQKQINNRLKALSESRKYSKSRLGYAQRKIVRAGLQVSLTRYWVICGTAGFISACLWALMGKLPVLAPVIFGLVTFVFPGTVLGTLASRRQAAFTKTFANAIDIMVRGLRSGMPVAESIKVISREMPDPIGSEFRIIVDQMNAGMPLSNCLERAYERVPTQELRFFATVIAIQSKTGGNLAEILSSISSVLRARFQLKEKAKALSGEARMSAIIVGALPFVVMGMLFIINRPYLELLWTTRAGYMFLAAAACMMGTGMYIINRLGKLDI